MSLLHGALGCCGGGGVSDDRRGYAGGCVITELVARQWVQKGDACRDWLLDAAGEPYRNRWIRVRLVSIRHAGCVVFTTILAWPAVVWLGVG